MSAPVHESPARGREGGTVRAPSAPGSPRPVQRMVVGSLLAALAAGCSAGSGIAVDRTPGALTPTASASATPADKQQEVLRQYQKFWASLTSVSRMPAPQRSSALMPYTVDPELKSLVAGMLATDAKGQVFYGADVPRALSASIAPDGMRAVIDDCQDSSHSGNANRATGKPVTVGKARNHVVVTMAKADGVWKVYFVSHTKTSC